MINIDQYLILISFISSTCLTILLIYLVLGLKKTYWWVRIYLFFIVFFVLCILSFVFIYIIADILEEIYDFFFIIKVIFFTFIMEFPKPMTIEGIFEDSSLIDLIISPMDNRSDGGSTPPRSPWLTRPVTPEVLIAVTPPNLPNFDPSVWVKGTVPTEFSQEQDRIARTGIRRPHINPAVVGYFHGRTTGAANHHTIFGGPLYPFTHIQGACSYNDFTYNIWVKPGTETHTYYITKENYNTVHQLTREDVIRYDAIKEIKSMTQFQRWAYFNRKTDEHINLTLQISDIPRILRSHQIPIANRGA